MPIISITPNQIIKIPWFLGFYISMISLALLSVIMVSVYVGGIKKESVDGKQYMRYPSSSILISAICFSVLSMITALVCFGYYFSIFRFQNSSVFLSILIAFALDCAMLGLSLYYLVGVKSYCPNPNDVFSQEFRRCVPQCPKGSLLDEKYFVCMQGCRDNSDCPNGQPCTLHRCCDLTTHTLTDGKAFCCPKENVFCLSGSDVSKCPEADLTCCASKVICKNDQGEPVCCVEADAICKDTGKGGQFCAIKCGNEFCDQDQICTITNLFGDTTMQCEGIDTKGCTRKGEPFYFPPAIGNFYPAYQPLDSSKLDDVLTCDPNAPGRCAGQIEQTFGNEENKYGYICGIPSHDAMTFESHHFTGGEQCTQQSMLQNNAIPGSTDKAYVQYNENGEVMLNLRNVIDATHLFQSSQTAGNYSPKSSLMVKTSITPEKGGVAQTQSRVQYFQGKIPTPETPGFTKDDLCTITNSYQDSCTPAFDACMNHQQCPFPDAESRYDCVYDEKTGIIRDSVAIQKYCLVKNGKLMCGELEAGQDPSLYLSCSDQESCDNYKKIVDAQNSKPSVKNTACAQYYYWDNNEPKNCCASMWDFVDGAKCGMKDIRNWYANTDANNFCPKGTKPFFYRSDKYVLGGKGAGMCYGKDAYAVDVHVQCCDIEKAQCQNKQSNAPCDDPYCLPDHKMVFTTNDINSFTGVLVGRGGTDHGCSPVHDGCDTAPDGCKDHLFDVLNVANNDTFK